MFRYNMTESISYDESNNAHTVYGIQAIDKEGNILKSFPDVLFDKGRMERIVEACNKEGLSFVHLSDVIEDVLSDPFYFK